MTTTSPIAVPSRVWNPSNQAPKTEKTGSIQSSSPSTTTTDTYTPSGNAPIPDPKANGTDLATLLKSALDDTRKSGGNAVDLSKLQQAMKDQLIEQMKQAQAALQSAGKDSKLVSDILYAVDKDQKAAAVPDEWGADQTSQRIVDFALAFRGSVKGMTDEQFIGAIRKSIQDGFQSAKGDMKELPGSSAKLFNDTYEAAMKKLDDTLAGWKKDAPSGVAADSPNPATPPQTAAPGPTSTFSVVA
jgi:hypothetical protein